MRLHIDLHILTTIFTLISSATLLRSDASLNTVEEFLDTLINSSRYDRRIRPFFDQRSKFKSISLSSITSSYSIRFTEACNVTMTIHINTISAINEVNMVRHID